MSAITHTFRFSGSGEDFGVRADGIVTLHTTESVATRNRISDAISVARWQDRPDILGSYNRLICTDGVLSCVPDDHASGGINPGSAGFKPLAWLFSVLDADEVRNPNYFSLQLSAVGSKAYFDANGWPSEIIDGFARSWIDEEKRIGRKCVLTNHADFQPPPNRSDAGPIATALVKARYKELTGWDDMRLRQIIQQDWTTKAGATSGWFLDAAGTRKHFTTATPVTSVAEITVDGFPNRGDARIVNYGSNGEPIIVPRYNMDPVPGTRVVGAGTIDGGFTQAQLNAAIAASTAAGIKAGRADMHTKAIAEATEHLSEVKALR